MKSGTIPCALKQVHETVIDINTDLHLPQAVKARKEGAIEILPTLLAENIFPQNYPEDCTTLLSSSGAWISHTFPYCMIATNVMQYSKGMAC